MITWRRQDIQAKSSRDTQGRCEMKEMIKLILLNLMVITLAGCSLLPSVMATPTSTTAPATPPSGYEPQPGDEKLVRGPGDGGHRKQQYCDHGKLPDPGERDLEWEHARSMPQTARGGEPDDSGQKNQPGSLFTDRPSRDVYRHDPTVQCDDRTGKLSNRALQRYRERRATGRVRCVRKGGTDDPKKILISIATLFMITLLAACTTPSTVVEEPSTATAEAPTAMPPTATLRPSASPTSPTPTETEVMTPTETITPTLLIQHFPSGQEFTITAIDMIDATTRWGIGGLVGTSDHVLRTTDSGTTWSDITPAEMAAAEGEGKTATGYFMDAQAGWVTYSNVSGVTPDEAVVWRTSDAGASWQASQPLDTSDPGRIL